MTSGRYRRAAEAACSVLFAKRPHITWSVRAGPHPDDRLLDCAERALIGPGWSDRRRDSFILGRAASAEVVSRCNGVGPVLRGRSGEPRWPSGLTGSIAHKDALALAVGMCRARQCASSAFHESVGIDIELTHEQLPADAWDLFLGAHEMQAILRWRRQRLTRVLSSLSRLTLLIAFSLKESIIKAVTHACGAVMSFHSFSLEPTRNQGATCLVRLPAALPSMRLMLDFAIRRPVIISYCHAVPEASASGFREKQFRRGQGGMG